jgi:hypothetical protein
MKNASGWRACRSRPNRTRIVGFAVAPRAAVRALVVDLIDFAGGVLSSDRPLKNMAAEVASDTDKRLVEAHPIDPPIRDAR